MSLWFCFRAWGMQNHRNKDMLEAFLKARDKLLSTQHLLRHPCRDVFTAIEVGVKVHSAWDQYQQAKKQYMKYLIDTLYEL